MGKKGKKFEEMKTNEREWHFKYFSSKGEKEWCEMI